MPLISELVTKLRADTKSFNSNIKNSQNKIVKFAKTVSKIGAAIAAAIGGVAVGAFIKLLSTINQTAKGIDKLAKTARKLGIITRELQFIQFQANLAGVPTEKLNMGLQRMTRRVAEAAQGFGEAKGALKELGLDAEQLAKLSPDKQFAAIGEALRGVASQPERVRLGFKLFDSEGVDIINAFTGDVAALRGEFDKLGIALTGKQTKAIEAYNDSVTKLSVIWEGFKNQLTVAVAPALQRITDFISAQIVKFGGLGPVANKAAKFMVGGLQLVVTVAQGVVDIIQGIVNGFKRAELAIAQFAQAFNELNFKVLGQEFNFDRAERILKLQRELQASAQSGPITAPLQQGLQQVRGALNQQKVEVTIRTEKGLKAEVAESPEVTRKINEMLNIITERAE